MASFRSASSRAAFFDLGSNDVSNAGWGNRPTSWSMVKREGTGLSVYISCRNIYRGDNNEIRIVRVTVEGAFIAVHEWGGVGEEINRNEGMDDIEKHTYR